jgi:hypothetical protein
MAAGHFEDASASVPAGSPLRLQCLRTGQACSSFMAVRALLQMPFKAASLLGVQGSGTLQQLLVQRAQGEGLQAG